MSQERIGIKTPEYVSLQFQLAGLGSRVAAFIIDQIILTAVNIAIFISLLIIITGAPDLWGFMDMGSLVFGIVIILLFVLNTGYFIAFEYFSGGRTIGKKVLGIRAIQENGHSLTLLSSFIRNFLRLIDSLPTSYFLGIIMIFFHPKHKRIGDLVAGTIVVHERSPKQKNKLSKVEKEIAIRGLTIDALNIDEWALKSISQKEWNLVKTYSNRLLQLPDHERYVLTQQTAQIICPKLGIDTTGKNNLELENIILVIYLILKEEWAFEL